MDFSFLPNLPKSDLDDRTFQELVEECILRIPRYCPEWTNYNPSDPGITLVELFAWLTDQMLLRFNQVPRRNYVTFLEILGIRLRPPVPAQTAVTFYLSAALEDPYTIPGGTEVATERTETDEAVVFSTDRLLTLGTPRIRHFLTADVTETRPQVLRDRFSNLWTQDARGAWTGREQPLFQEQPAVNNCFYLVFEPEAALDGNVIAVTLQGESAGSTGINPDYPPRRWEAWDGRVWQPILRQEQDDGTRGFSFEDPTQVDEGVGQREADVVLHLPLDWPVDYFASYQGRWLRCVYTSPEDEQATYRRSPFLSGLAARTIGGTTMVSQCTVIRDELLGESDGTPGQQFQLQATNILPRREGEHLVVMPPMELPQVWQEVHDFADSGPEDLHYTLDSLTGEIQFGPLIRESVHLREQTRLRQQQQVAGRTPTAMELAAAESQQRQYGKIPARGARLHMAAYRTGGGQLGNVQAGAIEIIKSAVPYVTAVRNHGGALGGADGESLEEAVIRVPRLLRTRDRAVTPEDFETLTLQASRGVARAYCPRDPTYQGEAGSVHLRVVPAVDTTPITRGEGLHPRSFELSDGLRQQVMAFLDERRLLGIQVQLHAPTYVGVSVQAEVGVEPAYRNSQAQQTLVETLQTQLYRFLNPVTGGMDGQGWPFGVPLYKSDLIALFQQTVGVRYLGTMLLFELRLQNRTWVRTLATNDTIEVGPVGLVCSWRDRFLRSGHTISVIN
ncbi:putative baseplate assembly protein [Leptolyngbya sp. PCC 6406]|uniref:putative baseplate assembly protein n=1 Tax=Leptolyngbya sp. PCC 6406 TaxID=1173264 RepID=UPI0002ACDE86|nr:putative baseplate assembly protein [Leptolyngbya sp. PCC 6406]